MRFFRNVGIALLSIVLVASTVPTVAATPGSSQVETRAKKPKCSKKQKKAYKKAVKQVRLAKKRQQTAQSDMVVWSFEAANFKPSPGRKYDLNDSWDRYLYNRYATAQKNVTYYKGQVAAHKKVAASWTKKQAKIRKKCRV